ncbi:hypothetical protein NBRC110019_07590 [Neptunitalea chrysea]|uniref:Uncharacterized protein n=1 Tax=Neptunitalea chrysea TaxID=1647581 RepID=A0A9W6B4Y5_9FLAO|nr:hypothetical protein [Neptunitalea chrysea]GLB51720.1 hypothetical protein NBRC110019_07590 [Neptunitalea chrysea]
MNFSNLYKELSTMITDTIDGIRWVDLWNSQVYNLDTEAPFPAPAVFMAFRSNTMQDMSAKVQSVQLQVDFFLFYETFLDTFNGAYNQDEALSYLEHLDSLNALFHGSHGEHYSNMKRINFSPVDTGGAGNLYSVTYTCDFVDRTAQKQWDEGSFADLTIDPAAEGNKFIVD